VNHGTVLRPTFLELRIPVSRFSPTLASFVTGAVALSLLTVATAQPAGAAGAAFRIDGSGNGHGIGMSQYGAWEQAVAGRSAAQILESYYAGTTLSTVGAAATVRVNVARDKAGLEVVVTDGAATITTGPTAWTAGPGTSWRVVPTGSACNVVGPAPRHDDEHLGVVCPTFKPTAVGTVLDLRVPAGSSYARYHRYRGMVALDVLRTSSTRLQSVVELPMDAYLYGLAEMPYSWNAAALQSQAIAARSYATYKALGQNAATVACRCHLYDSQQDQVFDGFDRQSASKWSSWRDAVDATTHTVVRADGAPGTRNGVVPTFYSSSSNGATEAKHEVWGGERLPYLTSRPDPWSTTARNPHRAWSLDVPAATFAVALGWDDVTSARVSTTTASGSAAQVVFTGRRGSTRMEATKTGSWVRAAAGLRSATIDFIGTPPFTDDDGSVHETAIMWIAQSGITKGCNAAGTRFCPGEAVTRGQMAAFLGRALHLKPGAVTFSDVPESHTFRRDISALAAAGITRGCNSAQTRFCPQDVVTRGQMAAFLARALKLPAGTATFADVPTGAPFVRDISALASAGITAGCNPPSNTKFCPHDPVTRAQMATFLHRALATG
jgi:SpoIID/LytB domain protein